MTIDYEQLTNTIFKRKSTRSFIDQPVKLLETNQDLVEAFGLIALIDEIKVKVRVLEKHEVQNNRAPYCIAFYSEDKPYALENIGFIGQQLDLILQSSGIGVCWWGMKKPIKEYRKIDGLNCFITMMAGIPKNPGEKNYPHDFNRKTLAEISIGDISSNRLIEAVRVAPSAINRQPWLIKQTTIGEANILSYDFYLKHSIHPLDLAAGEMRYIDLGIALAHIYVAAKADEKIKDIRFSFAGDNHKKDRFIANVKIIYL